MYRPIPSLIFPSLILVSLLASCPAARAAALPPVLGQRCVGCHGPTRQKGGLRLDSLGAVARGSDSGAVWATDKPAASMLLARVRATDAERMPPTGPPLTPAEVAQLAGWLEGKPWQHLEQAQSSSHWAFQPVRDSGPPVVDNPAWSRSPIDRFVFAAMRQQGLSPSARADQRVLIRRLTLDLTGLPPTPAEVTAFENDNAADAYERLVDRLLASPRYGERWARHWLDVARFAESNGFETNTARPNAWRYRDWVIGALNSDMPYDQFLKRQLAGDQLGDPAATGFLVGGPWDEVKSPDIGLTSQQRADELADMTGTVGSAFLGLTVACARCHAHKFDPISQTDYHAMVACLAGVQHGNRPLPVSPSQASEQAAKVQAIQALEKKLAVYLPAAREGRVVLSGPGQPLRQPTGRTALAEGNGRGQRGDPGAYDRWPTVSSGYFWWDNPKPGLVWGHKPGLSGRWRVWASWGTGFQTHAPDARLVLDADGDGATTGDQRELAVVDQRGFGDGTRAGEGKKLWSGWRLAGEVDLPPGGLIGWAQGPGGGVVTASDLLFEQVSPSAVSRPSRFASPASPQPHGRAPVGPLANTERFPARQARFVRMTIRATSGGSEPCIDELELFGPSGEVNLALGATATSSGDFAGNVFHQLKHVNDGLYGNSRSWIASTPGSGRLTLELKQPALLERIVWSRDRGEAPPIFADRVASDYTLETSADGTTWQFAAGSVDRVPMEILPPGVGWLPKPALVPECVPLVVADEQRLARLRADLGRLDQGQVAYIGRLTQPGPTQRFHRGDPLQPREEVSPGGITGIGPGLAMPANTPEAERRLKLAEWITDPAHPLTRRVIVNRLWQHHFGEGLVATPSDFGVNGARPSHPELLDWLAGELARQGWRLKGLHRLMVLSETYRQASLSRPAAVAQDAGNRWLWRFTPRRLEAEPLRDSILAISGNLDLVMGGPGFDLFEANTNYVKVYKAKELFGPAEWRRMVYQTKPRMQLDGIFGAFDCPDAGQIAPRRGRSITPLQALNLLNSRFLLDQSRLLADRLRAEAGAGAAGQVKRAFALLYSREPESPEQAGGEALIAATGLESFCRALFNTSEWMWLE